jgi:GNAT superfamily N-acetyltransferase
MESIEHPLGEADLPGCLALSKAAHWNQNEADWRLMLEFGHGWGISVGGALAASTLVLPYGGDFAWVSMVLVLPEHRRKGFASRLLRTAIGEMAKRGLTPVLDATPAGQTVYAREGFSDRWGFTRYFLKERKAPHATEGEARPLRESDWKAILELDRVAFGASREKVLRALHRRLPQAAWMVEGKGFVFGRDGREARQIGPLVSMDADSARALLSRALAAVEPPLYVDVADPAPLQACISEWGFALQRPFTRMVHGARAAPGRQELNFLVAGPELG